MSEFARINKLPTYVFNIMGQIKDKMIESGLELYDFGIGNPDQPPAPHIIEVLREAVLNPSEHRYSAARGIPELRKSISAWYGRRYNVDLDFQSETIVTMGSKEGLAHLALAALSSHDTVIVPNPCYPVHYFGCVIADANVRRIPLISGADFLANLESTIQEMSPKPKMLILNFPANPTTVCVDLAFFERIIEIAKEHQIWVVHDLAYADLVFDGYKAPSILQVPGAKEIAVESFTLSKSYNMAGWRVGFLSGNASLIDALAKIKSYIDYGSFAPIQKAAIAALEGPQESVTDLCKLYQRRRDVMCAGLQSAGWKVEIPKATMFLWVKIPEPFQKLGSLEFAKLLLQEAHVVVSPGMGFGEYGDQYVRISLVENEQRILQALQNIQQLMHYDFERSLPLEYSLT